MTQANDIVPVDFGFFVRLQLYMNKLLYLLLLLSISLILISEVLCLHLFCLTDITLFSWWITFKVEKSVEVKWTLSCFCTVSLYFFPCRRGQGKLSSLFL